MALREVRRASGAAMAEAPSGPMWLELQKAKEERLRSGNQYTCVHGCTRRASGRSRASESGDMVVKQDWVKTGSSHILLENVRAPYAEMCEHLMQKEKKGFFDQSDQWIETDAREMDTANNGADQYGLTWHLVVRRHRDGSSRAIHRIGPNCVLFLTSWMMIGAPSVEVTYRTPPP
jgi:hypothetical protein